MFTADSVPADVRAKVFVITGGNSGIGFEAAKVLVLKGARVVLACRDPGKMKSATSQLRTGAPGAQVDVVEVDLASLASIEKAAATISAMHPKIDVLLNNAGVMALPERATVDGFEMQFGTNHLGHFALTGRLLPKILAAPHGRVVTVSSMLHRSGHIDFASIPKPAAYDQNKQYSMSKLANVLFSYELDRRLKAARTNAIAVACHPGYSSTNLQAVGPEMKGSKFLGMIMKVSNALIAQPAAMGALGSLYASTGTDIEGGEYIGPVGMNHMRGPPVKSKSNAESYDQNVAMKLWDISEQLTHVVYPFPGTV